MSTPTIQPNIPIPTKIASKPEKYTYIDSLNVGDSFFLPCESTVHGERINFAQNLRAQLWKRKPWKFETRTGTRSQTSGGADEGSDWGIRVWRRPDGTILKRTKEVAA